MWQEWDEKVFFCPGFLHGELVRCWFTLAVDLCLKRHEWSPNMWAFSVHANLPNLFKKFGYFLPSFSRFWGSFTKGNLFTKCLFCFETLSFKIMKIPNWQCYICCWGRIFLHITYFCVHSKGKTQKRTNFKYMNEVLEGKWHL